MSDLKALILAAPDLRRETVSIPEWGVDLSVVQMNGRELTGYRAAIRDKDGAEVAAALVVYSVQDAAGAHVFTPEDIPALLDKSPSIIARLAAVAMKVNAMDATVEDARKN